MRATHRIWNNALVEPSVQSEQHWEKAVLVQ